MALADAIGRLPIAASLPPGVPVSLYLRDLADKDVQTNVRDSTDWSAVEDDPFFAQIPSDCEVVKIEELITIREEMTGTLVHEDEDDDIDAADQDSGSLRSDSEDRDVDRYSEYSDRSMREESETREETVAGRSDLSGKAASAVQSVSSKDGDKAADVRVSRDRSASPRARFPHHRSRSYGRVSSSQVDPHLSSHRRSDHHERTPLRDNAYRDYRAPRDRRESFKRQHSRDFDSHQGQKLRRRRSGDRPRPPPPPPPPRHRFYDGQEDHSPPNDYSNENPIATNGHSASPHNGEDIDINPDKLSPAWGNAGSEDEKERAYRDPSEESNAGPRRQEEPSPASKKRHPQIAAAYR